MALAHFGPVENLQNITIRLFDAYGITYSGAFALVGDKEGTVAREAPDERTRTTKGRKGKKTTPGYE